MKKKTTLNVPPHFLCLFFNPWNTYSSDKCFLTLSNECTFTYPVESARYPNSAPARTLTLTSKISQIQKEQPWY